MAARLTKNTVAEERAQGFAIRNPTFVRMRLEGWGGPDAASRFETHRSASILVELSIPRERCDAPPHEAERAR
jgi:hypothetical protein